MVGARSTKIPSNIITEPGMIQIIPYLFCNSLVFHYLCSDDTLHPIATPAAVAQKHIRLCADLLQQQSVEARLLLAHACSVRIILSDFKFHLLLQ